MTRSPYITRKGYEALNAELKYLWKVERPQVTQQVHDAAALGDRSENAEYIYGKKRLREIDRRIRYLAKRLDVLCVVDYSQVQEGRVFFGAYVRVVREGPEGLDECAVYRIVGGDEIAANSVAISVDSPMAKALIGKAVDDEVRVNTPSGWVEWVIDAIQYEPF
ncbi:transcription elongation factor GreB [Marinagarivorans algicola]|uniref:transcription elongation factor GreB n=1 Tax=Marinagarivorans algicola TaxID=1513270 RepID=UPI0006B44A11|nr:transcription elongation factor GreB [Marinagarivorans algicola]